MSQVRNPYEKDVDFSALALQDAVFSKVLKSNGQLDFTDPTSVQQLTKSLLKRDFGLDVDLPDDRLCPPVPNRLNYILWMQDLLDTTSTKFKDVYDENREITGLDVGTGASCIYPLLGCARRPRWRFMATDIDFKNMQYARKNVLHNRLTGRIRPVQTEQDDPLIPLDKLGVEQLDFTMCNPPFYSSLDELMQLAKAKSRPPNSACTGAEVEMVTKGGEVGFVQRMIDESMTLGRRVQWYSSMLGRLSSLEELVPILQQRGVSNWAVTEFVQGTRTRRWGLAWSWSSVRTTSLCSRRVGALHKSLMPFPPEHKIFLPGRELSSIEKQLGELMEGLELRWQFKEASHQGVGFADANVWSRAARRKRSALMDLDASDSQLEEAAEEPALGFKLTLTNEEAIVIEVRWLVGRDSVIFESFCGMLRRRLIS